MKQFALLVRKRPEYPAHTFFGGVSGCRVYVVEAETERKAINKVNKWAKATGLDLEVRRTLEFAGKLEI